MKEPGVKTERNLRLKIKERKVENNNESIQIEKEVNNRRKNGIKKKKGNTVSEKERNLEQRRQI